MYLDQAFSSCSLRTAILGVLVLLLDGCGGVTESLNRIVGYAPDDGSCRVDIVDRETSRVVHSEQVRGKFSAGFGLNENSPRKVDILGVCGSKTVKSLRNIVPGSIGRTDLGSLSP